MEAERPSSRRRSPERPTTSPVKCLVIAAGRGLRLSDRGESKPLIALLGLPLIERTLLTAKKAGLTDFCVVTGYEGESVRCFLDELASRHDLTIQHVVNREWQKGNGLSVLKAKDHLHEKFLLLMADHVVEPRLLGALKRKRIAKDEICLAVDHDVGNPRVDLEDVTKVRVRGGKVTRIGKALEDYNGYDTGCFLASPALFGALSKSIANHDDSSLSGGIAVLAKRGKVRTLDIGDLFWLDVDDAKALDAAERMLLDQLRKPSDGPLSKYLNRPLSTRLTRRLARTSLTPNQISLFCFLVSLAAAPMLAMKPYWALAMGGVLAQIASIIDGCDGEVARLKFQESEFGGWFDAVLDRYADAFLLLGLTWHALGADPSPLSPVLFVGFMAIIGSFMISYTADKYDGLMKARLDKGGSFRMGRDIRVFMIFLGAVLNQPFLALILIAVSSNAEAARRVALAYTRG